MMEARPAAALIVAEADFLLEVVIIALDAPAQLGEIDEAAERHVAVDGCEPEFGGRGLALGPFDEQCLFGEPCFAPDWRDAHAYAGKARLQPLVGAFSPSDGAPGVLGQAECQGFDTDARRLRIVLAHRAHFDARHDGCHVAQPQLRESLAQDAVGPITRIHQHYAGGNARQQSRADLLQRNLRLGLEPDRARNMRLGAAGPIVDPLLRQIQSIGDRQAGMMVGDRQRHHHLAIGLLAELPPRWRARSFPAHASFVSMTALSRRSGNRTICPRFRSSSNAFVTSSSTQSLLIECSDKINRTLSRSRIAASIASIFCRRSSYHVARTSSEHGCSASLHG